MSTRLKLLDDDDVGRLITKLYRHRPWANWACVWDPQMGGGTDEIAFSSGTPVTNHETNEFDFLTASSGGTRQPNGVKEKAWQRVGLELERWSDSDSMHSLSQLCVGQRESWKCLLIL